MQTKIKSQISKLNGSQMVNVLKFVICDFFVICDLVFCLNWFDIMPT